MEGYYHFMFLFLENKIHKQQKKTKKTTLWLNVLFLQFDRVFLQNNINIYIHPCVQVHFWTIITPTVILSGIHFLPNKNSNMQHHFMTMTHFHTLMT